VFAAVPYFVIPAVLVDALGTVALEALILPSAPYDTLVIKAVAFPLALGAPTVMSIAITFLLSSVFNNLDAVALAKFKFVV